MGMRSVAKYAYSPSSQQVGPQAGRDDQQCRCADARRQEELIQRKLTRAEAAQRIDGRECDAGWPDTEAQFNCLLESVQTRASLARDMAAAVRVA